MVGVIAPSSRLNSLGSICYCFLALGLHTYSCYAIVERYREAISRSWPGNGGGGTPVECTILLVLMVLACLLMPFFCLASFMKVGNLANDQVQLGFHHALAPAAPPSSMTALAKEVQSSADLWKAGLRRCWSHFCPISPFVHLVSAFLLVLPQVLLTPVEVKHNYLSTVMCWSSELDFLYSSQRILLSDVKSIVNMTEVYNASQTLLPTSHIYTGGRLDTVTVSVAFVNFSLALATLLVRYASVFWYTNKVLALLFTLQLFAMVLTNIFGFCSFSVLYCICYNRKVFRNLNLSISCGVDIMLYLFSGFILLLSSVIVFEYGSNHFHAKFKIVERHHNADSKHSKRRVIRFASGCQGHVPHSCAMASLIALAVFKGPLLYDLVSIMRHTGDSLLLSGIVCDVCYMVLWVVLWLGLTIKQEWQFRILDFVPSSQPRYDMPLEENVSVRSSQIGQGDDEMDIEHYLQRRKPTGSRDNPQRYSDPLPIGLRNSGDVYQQSDAGTEESDIANAAAADPGGTVDPSGHFKPSIRIRRTAGQRVTFDESIRSRGSVEEPRTRSLPRQRGYDTSPSQSDNHVNVTADVHALQAPQEFQDEDSSQQRQISPENGILTREYRNSLRNKCGEYYSSNGDIHQATCEEEEIATQNAIEPLPTLMSSFRDKVRESSIAASNFKEREKSMMEHYNFKDPPLPNQDQRADMGAENSERRRIVGISDDGINHCDKTFKGGLNNCDEGLNNLNATKINRIGSGLSRRKHESEKDSNSLPKKHNSSMSSDEGHQSSFTPSTVDSFDNSLPPVHEDQLGHLRSGVSDFSPVGREYRHMNGTVAFRQS